MQVTNVLAIEYERDNQRLRDRVVELEARLRSMTPDVLRFGPLAVDVYEGTIRQGDERCGHMTRTELAILRCLAKSPGVAVPYATIERETWGEQSTGKRRHNEGGLRSQIGHLVQVNVNRMAKKLGPYFRTVREYGVAVDLP